MKILEDIAQQYNGRLEYGFKDGYTVLWFLLYIRIIRRKAYDNCD